MTTSRSAWSHRAAARPIGEAARATPAAPRQGSAKSSPSTSSSSSSSSSRKPSSSSSSSSPLSSRRDPPLRSSTANRSSGWAVSEAVSLKVVGDEGEKGTPSLFLSFVATTATTTPIALSVPAPFRSASVSLFLKHASTPSLSHTQRKNAALERRGRLFVLPEDEMGHHAQAGIRRRRLGRGERVASAVH